MTTPAPNPSADPADGGQPLKRLQVPTEVVDVATGRVVERRTADFTIMPPLDPSACATCGRRHPADQPHDVQQLHYQYTFFAEHGRWPTWADALAHCPEPVREHWEAALRDMGQWTEAPESAR